MDAIHSEWGEATLKNENRPPDPGPSARRQHDGAEPWETHRSLADSSNGPGKDRETQRWVTCLLGRGQLWAHQPYHFFAP